MDNEYKDETESTLSESQDYPKPIDNIIHKAEAELVESDESDEDFSQLTDSSKWVKAKYRFTPRFKRMLAELLTNGYSLESAILKAGYKDKRMNLVRFKRHPVIR